MDILKPLSPVGSPLRQGIDRSGSAGSLATVESKNFYGVGSVGGSLHYESSDVGSDNFNVIREMRIIDPMVIALMILRVRF